MFHSWVRFNHQLDRVLVVGTFTWRSWTAVISFIRHSFLGGQHGGFVNNGEAYYGEPYAEAKRLADLAPQDFCPLEQQKSIEQWKKGPWLFKVKRGWSDKLPRYVGIISIIFEKPWK